MLLLSDFLILHDLGVAAGEIGLVDVLDFSFGVLSRHGFNHPLLGAVGDFQETQGYRSVLETPEMSVLREHVHRFFYMCRTLLFGVHDARPDVDYLGSSVLKHYNHG